MPRTRRSGKGAARAPDPQQPDQSNQTDPETRTMFFNSRNFRGALALMPRHFHAHVGDRDSLMARASSLHRRKSGALFMVDLQTTNDYASDVLIGGRDDAADGWNAHPYPRPTRASMRMVEIVGPASPLQPTKPCCSERGGLHVMLLRPDEAVEHGERSTLRRIFETSEPRRPRRYGRTTLERMPGHGSGHGHDHVTATATTTAI